MRIPRKLVIDFLKEFSREHDNTIIASIISEDLKRAVNRLLLMKLGKAEYIPKVK